jgi:hypothetical protein
LRWGGEEGDGAAWGGWGREGVTWGLGSSWLEGGGGGVGGALSLGARGPLCGCRRGGVPDILSRLGPTP